VTSSNSGLKTYLLRVISGDQTGVYAFLVRIFLNGLECIYRILSGLKFMMAHRHQLPVPVISIGNITVGGTGKTPTVIWLVKLLKAAGFTPAILTRGYGGQFQKEGYSFTNNALVDLTAVATGDEPFLLAKLLPDILIGVGRERYQNGLKALVSNPAIDLFVLDDGFQHWSLARDLDIIVIDASRPFSNRHLLPRGFLREPLSSLKRAGIILLTRTTKVDQTCIKDLTNELLTINPNVTIASIEEEPSKLISLTDFTIGRDSGQIAAAQFLSGRKISAITGIGNPRQFLASLENMGAEVGYFKAYPDHYNWEEAEIIDLIKGLAENGFLELIVTAKDGVKLEPWADMFDKYRLTCYILSLEFSVGDQQVIKRIKTVGKAVNS
jgi:tetraacyldisaccharide 4'-kinase